MSDSEYFIARSLTIFGKLNNLIDKAVKIKAIFLMSLQSEKFVLPNFLLLIEQKHLENPFGI